MIKEQIEGKSMKHITLTIAGIMMLIAALSLTTLISSEKQTYTKEKPELCYYYKKAACVCFFKNKKKPGKFKYIKFTNCEEVRKTFLQNKWYKLARMLEDKSWTEKL